jgi:hypothetical protein
MVAAFLDVFPNAPTLNLVEPKVGHTWDHQRQSAPEVVLEIAEEVLPQARGEGEAALIVLRRDGQRPWVEVGDSPDGIKGQVLA